jgi:hypothetical protein
MPVTAAGAVKLDESGLPQPAEVPAAIETKSTQDDWELASVDLVDQGTDRHQEAEGLYNVKAAAASHPGFEVASEVARKPETGPTSYPEWTFVEPEAETLNTAVATNGDSSPSDAQAMTEVKKLMGEIARTIEEAAQSVDRPEAFAMSLRAGQLKIAERYPFLDPFAAEIEYLTGEIVFVGQATVEDFVTGLTEALKLAVQGVMKSTTYPDRFRAYVTEDLKKLLARERQTFEATGLSQVIDQIIQF